MNPLAKMFESSKDRLISNAKKWWTMHKTRGLNNTGLKFMFIC